MTKVNTINGNQIFQYVMPVIESNMFVILNSPHALIIDPHESKEVYELLYQNQVKKICIILTHEHFDHISGVNFFKENWECTVYGSNTCKENVIDSKKNLSDFSWVFLMDKEESLQNKWCEVFVRSYTCAVDVGFDENSSLEWSTLKLRLIETPGHSQGSICVVVTDEEQVSHVFTGDSLVQGAKVITSLPGGSKKDYLSVTSPFLESLSDETIIYPGHGRVGKKIEM